MQPIGNGKCVAILAKLTRGAASPATISIDPERRIDFRDLKRFCRAIEQMIVSEGKAKR